MSLRNVPGPTLDSWIRRAALSSAQALRELRRQGPEGLDAPIAFDRRVSTLSALHELEERPVEPVLAGARAWMRELLARRVLFEDELRLAQAMHAARPPNPRLEPPDASLALAKQRLLEVEPEPLRRLWASRLLCDSGEAHDAARRLAERRAELARRLGLAGADALQLPCDGPAMDRVAERVLELTEPFVSDLDEWHRLPERTLGRDAREGWPAKLGPRWLLAPFADTGLLDGVPLKLDGLPAARGGASFLRAFAAVGAAWAEAALPPAAPFVLARPPQDLRRARRAALFASLPVDPVFIRREQGLSKGAAQDQARKLTQALVWSLRLAALRVLARSLLASTPEVLAARWRDLAGRVFRTDWPPTLLGVFPALHSGDAVELLGALLGAADRAKLIAQHDEDWWRSPHAALSLRHEQSLLAEEDEGAPEGALAACEVLAPSLAASA